MDLLDQHQSLREKIFEYFGYVEDWRVLPLDDARGLYWQLNGEGPGEVLCADSKEDLDEENIEEGEYYSFPIYTQRHLPKWVYRGPEYTMIVVDTLTDGNKLLMIFDNEKEL